MITETDAINTIEFENYYVILPSTQIWDIEKFRLESNQVPGKLCQYGFSYNSGSNQKFLTVDEIRELIKDNVDGAQSVYGD